LVLAEVGLGDVVLRQITSKPYADASAIPLSEQDFQSGNLSRDSFIRVGKLFTANEALIVGVAGTLNRQKIREVITTLVHIL
jgi:mRNA interferase MazF